MQGMSTRAGPWRVFHAIAGFWIRMTEPVGTANAVHFLGVELSAGNDCFDCRSSGPSLKGRWDYGLHMRKPPHYVGRLEGR